MRMDQVLVIDIEATCWADQPPPGETNEIIEIGLCAVDVANLAAGEPRSLLVQPVRSHVSAYCTELTTLTPAQVAAGIPFADACQILRKVYRARGRLWASWGDYDRRIFEKQCVATATPYPFGKRHLNIKGLCALLMGLPEEPSMAEGLELLHLPLMGTHHRGGDDAANIARILIALVQRFRMAPLLTTLDETLETSGG